MIARSFLFVAAMTLGGAALAQAPGGGAARPLTLAEFQARQEGRLMAADTDGDGRVSQAEWAAAASARKGGGRGGAGLFERMDSNRDGFLDRAEIDAALARRFRRMDSDSDGVLSQAERRAAIAERVAAKGKEPDQ